LKYKNVINNYQNETDLAKSINDQSLPAYWLIYLDQRLTTCNPKPFTRKPGIYKVDIQQVVMYEINLTGKLY